MFPLFLLGVALVVGLYLLVRAFVTADPRVLAVAVRYGGIALGAGALVLLVVTGRLGTALAIGAFLVPVIGHWRSHRNRMRASAGPAAGQVSQVETLFLRMTLNHDTGDMTGAVLHGRFRGRALEELSLEQLLTLLEDCRRDDAPSAGVLEAWLDRTHPDWRDEASGGASGGASGRGGGRDGSAQAPASGGAMTREEAYEILDLPPGSPPERVKEAHRRLMMKVHPDHGGSTYLAAKINQAKDLLLHT
ncbi:MAG TPA: hypothetical protein VGE72_21105 [Azospirillum sp.]